MGFPVGYTDISMPKILLHALSLIGYLRTIVTSVFTSFGLSDFLEPDFSSGPVPLRCSAPRSAVLIRELLPAMKLETFRESGVQLPESCAVCLYEFEGGEEIRQLRNCKHIFHKGCIDRWMDQDRDTCPLCRNSFIPDELRVEFETRLWRGLFAGNGDDEGYLLNCELSDGPSL